MQSILWVKLTGEFKIVKTSRGFPFESMVRMDENKNWKLELGIDRLSDNFIEFDIIFVNPVLIRDVLLFLSELVTIKPAKVELLKIDYEDYFKNEIIRRIRKIPTYVKDKPNYMREDLKQLLERREDLMSRISNQMKYFHSNKSKIDQMLLKRGNYWKTYSGPMLSVTPKSVIFEVLSEYMDVYNRIELIDPTFIEEEVQYGNSWVEWSLDLVDDLKSITPDFSKDIQDIVLTSRKPRTDIRILRTSDTVSRRIFEIPEKWFFSFQIFSLLEYLSHQSVKIINPIEINLDKFELFELVNETINRYSNREIINLKIIKSTDKKLEFCLTEKQIIIYSNDDKLPDHPIQSQITTTIFHQLKFVVQFAKNCKIKISGNYLPTVFKLNLNDIVITCGSNVFTSKQEQYLIKILLYSLINQADLGLKQEIEEIISKNQRIHINEFEGMFKHSELKSNIIHLIYNQSLLFLPRNGELIWRDMLNEGYITKLKLDKKLVVASSIVELYRNKLTVSPTTKGSKVQLLGFDYKTQVILNENRLFSGISCDCQKFNKNYPCSHVLALKVIILLEGVLIG